MALISSGNLIITHVPEYYTFSTISQLSTASISQQTNNNTVFVEGYHVPFDDGGGLFTFNSSALSADDMGAVVRPTNIGSGGSGRWIRKYPDGYGRPEMWGARGNGLADDQDPIQRSVLFLEKNYPNYLLFSSKVYMLSNIFNSYINIPPGGSTTRFHRTQIGVGFYAQNTNRARLTLKGMGSNNTILSSANPGPAQLAEASTRPISVINICEQVDYINIHDLTIDRSGFVGAGNYTSNCIEACNNGPYGTPPIYDMATDLISITGCKLINGNRAATFWRSNAYKGIRKLIFSNNEMRYPRGADNNSSIGGGQIAYAKHDVEYLESCNNIVEGTSNSSAAGTGGTVKDGFWAATGQRALLKNNLIERCWVESDYSSFVYEIINLPANTTYTIPPINQNVNITFDPTDTNYGRNVTDSLANYLMSYYRIAGFYPGEYITIRGGTYAYVNNAGVFQFNKNLASTGYYLVNSIVSSARGFGVAWTTNLTRVSGINDPEGYMNWIEAGNENQYAVPGGTIPQDRRLANLTVSGGQIVAYGLTNKWNISVSAIGNTTTFSKVNLPPANLWCMAPYALRVDQGNVFLSGNSYAGSFTLAEYVPGDVGARAQIIDNTFYAYNLIPVNPIVENTGSVEFVGTQYWGITLGCSGNIIRNNRFVLWNTFNGNTASTVANYVPQLNYSGTWSGTVSSFYDSSFPATTYQNITRASTTGNLRGRGGIIIDNTFVSTVPASSWMIDPFSFPVYQDYSGGSIYNTDNFVYLPYLSGNKLESFNSASMLRAYNGGNHYITNYARLCALDGFQIKVLGYNTPGDGGVGWYRYDKTSTSADNGTTVFRPGFISASQPGRWIRV